MTKVSIITTCFNAAATIRETIESIRANRGDNEIEHIITDAGSTDGTLDIVRSYGDEVKLFITPGLNQSAGINYGLKQATGEILAFLNADDLYYPDTIKKIVAAFDTQPDCTWLIGQCPIIDEHGVEQTSWISHYKNFWLRHYSYFWLLVENFICQPAVFFRRSIVEQYGYFSDTEHYCMDYDFWLRIGKTERPIIMNENLAQFRRMANTKSNSGYEKQFIDDYRLGMHYATLNGYVMTKLLKLLAYYRTVLVYRRLY